jgi:hypothetical protein
MKIQCSSRPLKLIAFTAVFGLASCTETVVYRNPPPTVVVERGPYAPPPPRVEYRPAPHLTPSSGFKATGAGTATGTYGSQDIIAGFNSRGKNHAEAEAKICPTIGQNLVFLREFSRIALPS